MWTLIIGAVLIVLLAGLVYLADRLGKFAFVRRLAKGKKAVARLLGLGMAGAALAILAAAIGTVNAVIAMLHLIVIWGLCELAFWGAKKLRKRDFRRYYAGLAALGITAVYLTAAWCNAHRVVATRYTVDTGRDLQPLRIVQFSDSHIGAIFGAEGLAGHLERIQAEKPDAVVITGDFVDDDTSRDELMASCRALGKLKTTYGVFFVYGNHDRGYMDAQRRGWTAWELEEALRQSGVILLQDQIAELGRDYRIIGREDATTAPTAGGRASMEALMEGLEPGRYNIVLDHQPTDYAAEEAAGADLVLSGHTHGGQFFPFNYMGEWTGINDATYGLEKRGDTTFIVSSGIADWALGFKTGCISEYVVIDIR